MPRRTPSHFHPRPKPTKNPHYPTSPRSRRSSDSPSLNNRVPHSHRRLLRSNRFICFSPKIRGRQTKLRPIIGTFRRVVWAVIPSPHTLPTSLNYHYHKDRPASRHPWEHRRFSMSTRPKPSSTTVQRPGQGTKTPAPRPTLLDVISMFSVAGPRATAPRHLSRSKRPNSMLRTDVQLTSHCFSTPRSI
jgi:hypothetical protein